MHEFLTKLARPEAVDWSAPDWGEHLENEALRQAGNAPEQLSVTKGLLKALGTVGKEQPANLKKWFADLANYASNQTTRDQLAEAIRIANLTRLRKAFEAYGLDYPISEADFDNPAIMEAVQDALRQVQAEAIPPGPLPPNVDPTNYYASSPFGPGVEPPPPAAEPGLLDRILSWPRARWDVLAQAFKQNPVLASALAAAGPTASLGGAYGTYRGAKEKSLLRSLLFGALSGAGGGTLYHLLSAPGEGLSSLWLPLAIGALIGAGGGVGAYGLGRLLG